MTQLEFVEPVSDMDAVEAKEFVEYIHGVQNEGPRRVVDAYRRRAWLALGYGSWADMCDGEDLRLPRELTPELRAGGLSIRAIAAVTGVSHESARKDSGVNSGQGELTPEPTIGLDGKSYPASRAEPERLPDVQPPEDPLLPEIADRIRERIAQKQAKLEPVMLQLQTHTGKTVEYPKPAGRATFNETTGEGISWAAWSWNPVTGCLHGCDYCYARAIAHRFTDGFPAGFTPLFHEERLDAPANTSIPQAHRDDPAYRRVFVCSMADLYGRWVPDEWIDRVHGSMLATPYWEYLLLTKFPSRYVGLKLPPKAWVGTSVDEQKRVRIAEDAFRKIDGVKVKWLSLEPLREPLEFADLSMFDWVVIGAQTETRQPDGTVEAFGPPSKWVDQIKRVADAAGIPVHEKPNLYNGRPGAQPRNEYPAER